MNEDELRDRTKKFALRIIRLGSALPSSAVGRIITHQMIRSGTSVGANYRAACKARSRAEFTAKLGVVEEEADETAFWLELVMEAGLQPKRRVAPLHDETRELVAIMAASRKTLKQA